ncbi:hypothetical protein FQ775_01230 [Nitratireductor mangrovi]|uniref:Cytochrome c-552/DMSO reductase-like haem-binding domain-containing protein n=1 Tax=Nitratireductor mangrovi TaxID=2599600 RepID=A0A5B8KU38_9HYPH|nr:ethylbenzene dehydrogenase-related protein [Nitratireductor mangrovi]QDY99103.1 hypothetical protein FQ775_01230 [Nitratireductor mangrovi]
MTRRRYSLTALALALGFAAGGPAAAQAPADWSELPVHEVTLFWPGQASLQWLRSDEHAGGAQVAAGMACRTCHKDDAAELGRSIVGGGPLEPRPIEGKKPVIDLRVQAAHDDENLYLRFQWATQNPYPGVAHPHWRFDGEGWERWGAPRLHPDVWQEGGPAIYEDRLSMMLDGGSVPAFAEQGCWLSCHNSMRDMPDEPNADKVKAHPLLGEVLGKSDVRKYLAASRADEDANWEATKTPEEIAGIKVDRGFADLMQWRAHRSNPVGMADDGYVLEYRLSDAGQPVFTSNWDKDAKRPKYMFDAVKTGYRSRRADEIVERAEAGALILGENTVPFDPDLDWTEGEMVPQYVLSRAQASGSAADNMEVLGTWEDGTWTVVWVRPLDTGEPDDAVLDPGSTLTVTLAVHDDNITTRGHHVSFPLTLGLDVEADITVRKVD